MTYPVVYLRVMSKVPGIAKHRLKILLTLAILLPIGFYTKFYEGIGSWWVQDYLGGILYEIFLCLIASLVLYRLPPWQISIGVFTITSILECLQLWHHTLLETLRQTLIGHLILGSFFDLWDFPHYLIGSLLGWTALNLLHQEKHT